MRYFRIVIVLFIAIFLLFCSQSWADRKEGSRHGTYNRGGHNQGWSTQRGNNHSQDRYDWERSRDFSRRDRRDYDRGQGYGGFYGHDNRRDYRYRSHGPLLGRYRNWHGYYGGNWYYGGWRYHNWFRYDCFWDAPVRIMIGIPFFWGGVYIFPLEGGVYGYGPSMYGPWNYRYPY